jgi:hypothetical protein
LAACFFLGRAKTATAAKIAMAAAIMIAGDSGMLGVGSGVADADGDGFPVVDAVGDGEEVTGSVGVGVEVAVGVGVGVMVGPSAFWLGMALAFAAVRTGVKVTVPKLKSRLESNIDWPITV